MNSARKRLQVLLVLLVLTLRLDYPNDFDRTMAKQDGRTDLGGDIMLHGGNASIGCLAVGDEAIEELFTLAADVGLGRIEVWLCPLDFRVKPFPELRTPQPGWLPGLYQELGKRLATLPKARR